MTSSNLERKRHKFLGKIKSVADSINFQLLDNNYQNEVYFSGRDEDFVVISFKRSAQLVELSIGLTNHRYYLTGNEHIYYRVFNINNGEFIETLQGVFTSSDNKKEFFESPIYIIIKKFQQGLKSTFL